MHMTSSSTTLTMEASKFPPKCLKDIPNNGGHISFPQFVVLLFDGTRFCILFMLDLLIQFIKAKVVEGIC